LVGSINPTLNIVPSSYGGNSGSTTGASTLSGSYALNILSPNASASTGVSGMFLFVVVGIIGLVLLVRSF